MADRDYKGSKRSRDDGLEPRIKGTDEPAPKRLKENSAPPSTSPVPAQDGGSIRRNRTLGSSVRPRRSSQPPVGASPGPSPSVAIRAIQEMNGEARNNSRTTTRVPSGPSVLRNNRVPSLTPRNTVQRVQVPVRSVRRPTGPGAPAQSRDISRSSRSSSSAGPAHDKSQKPTKPSNASTTRTQPVRPPLSRPPRYEGNVRTLSEIIASHSKGPAAAVAAPPVAKSPAEPANAESDAKKFQPVTREEGETMEAFRKRQLDSLALSPPPPRLEKKRNDETMKDFVARKNAHYETYNLDKTGKVKEPVDEKEEGGEDGGGQGDNKNSNNPNSMDPARIHTRFLQPDDRPATSSTLPKPREGFNIGPLIEMNAGRDPYGAGIEFPEELLELLQMGSSDLISHRDSVFIVAIEQNRHFAFFNILAASQRMEVANHLALSFFRSEVAKILPELYESPGLDHEEEKSSLAQLKNDLNTKRWTKDIWYKATGDIRGDARLSWYIEREGETTGLVTLSAALPGTEYQVTVKVERQKLVQ
ncbi:hypothetical protein PG990_009205 [Apiospora arundinis]